MAPRHGLRCAAFQHNGEIFPHQAPQAASAHGVIHRSAAVKAAGKVRVRCGMIRHRLNLFIGKVQRRRCLSGRAGSRRQGGGCGGRGWHGGGRSARLRRTRGQNKAQRQRGGTDMFFIEAPPCVDVSRICPALSAVFNIDVFCIRVVTKAVETKNGCRKMPFKSTLRQPFSLAAEPYFSRSPP